MSNLLKNLLFALGLSVLLWVGYKFFIQKDTDELLAPSAAISPEAEQKRQELLSMIQRLDSYQVDGEIFQDARFGSLVDFRTQLTEEPVGRSNPFAPVN